MSIEALVWPYLCQEDWCEAWQRDALHTIAVFWGNVGNWQAELDCFVSSFTSSSLCLSARPIDGHLNPERARVGWMKNKDSSFVVWATLSSAIGNVPRGPCSQKHERLKPWQKARIHISISSPHYPPMPQDFLLEEMLSNNLVRISLWAFFSDPFRSRGRSEWREAGGVKPQCDTVGFDHASQSKL